MVATVRPFIHLSEAWDYIEDLYYLTEEFQEIGMRKVNGKWQVYVLKKDIEFDEEAALRKGIDVA